MIAKLLVTIATLIYAVAPLFADLNSTHVFYPEWTAHSKLHMVWLLGTNSSIAVLSLWLIWNRSQVLLAGVLGFCVVGGFWIAASTQGLYGGALTDTGGIDVTILGLEGNAIAFGFVVVLLSLGLLMRARTDEAIPRT